MGTEIITGLFLLAWSFLFAVLEIAIEGPVGWALGGPSWRKKSPIYAALMGGKELTGYHLWMFFLPFLLLHLPFVFAYHWGVLLFSWSRELELLACYFLLAAHWDFSWFVLNPDFGLKRFRKGEIWWHKQWVGRVPVDYLFAVGLAILFTFGSYLLGGGVDVWVRMGVVAAVLVVGLVFFVAFAPVFHAWYTRMCNTYVLTDDWAEYLTEDELKSLHKTLRELRDLRDWIAIFGQYRAKREQLGE